MRSGPGGYPEYHSSADNLDLVQEDALVDSLQIVFNAIQILEGEATCTNLSPYGEPQLGRRGLYSAIGGCTDSKAMEMALLWVLNYSDGEHSLLDIAAHSGLDFSLIREGADALLDAGLLSSGSGQVVQTIEPSAEVTVGEDGIPADEPDFWNDFMDGGEDLSHDDEVFRDFG